MAEIYPQGGKLSDVPQVEQLGSSDYLHITIGTKVYQIQVSKAADGLKLGGYVFIGIATLATVPLTEQNCFYAANETGTYTNFGNIVVLPNELAFLAYNKQAGTWSKKVIRTLLHNDIGERDVPGAHTATAIRFISGNEDLSVHDKIIELENEDASQKAEYTSKFDDFKVSNSFSAEGKQLKNVGDPVNDLDAANKRWTLLQASGNGSPKGIAYTTTTPSNPVRGDWYWTGEDGNYTGFGVSSVTAGGRLIYDGAQWVFVKVYENYATFTNTDPTSIGTPESGKYFEGVLDGKPWVKDSTGAITYVYDELFALGY